MNITGNKYFHFDELGINVPDHTRETDSYSSYKICDDKSY